MNHSIPLYLGQPEIVWSAWEAIGTVSAVFFTIFLLFGDRVIRVIWKPHIKTTLRRWRYIQENMEENEYGDVQLGYFKFYLSVKNAQYLWTFGDEVFDLEILWWLDTKVEGIWTYQGRIDPIPYIPTNESWITEFEQDKIMRVPEGEYKLILKYVTTINDETRELGKQSWTFSIPSEENRL